MKMRPQPCGSPTPLSAVQLPTSVADLLKECHVATCEQALDVIVRRLTRPEGPLPAGATPQELFDAKAALISAVPQGVRANLERSDQTRWTETRPLGVPTPPDRTRVPGRSGGENIPKPDESDQTPTTEEGES